MRNIIITRYSPEHDHEWNDFIKYAKNPLFMFDRNYMDYHNDRFLDHSLMFYNDDKLVSVLPANEKDNVLVSHGGLTYGGLILDINAKQHIVNDCIVGMVQYARDHGFKKIIYKTVPHIFHEQPCEEDRYALFQIGAKICEMSAATVLNLSRPIKMLKGRKAQISRSKREGVTVEVLTEKKDYEAFIKLENEVLKSKHNTQAVHTSDELFLLHERFPEQIHLFAAMKAGEMIAGSVVYEYGQAVHTQYLAANETARVIGGLDLTVATIIDTYQGKKLWLDFGTSTEKRGTYLNEGLIYQKEGFGGRTNVYTQWEICL